MTQVALQSLNFSTKVLDRFLKGLRILLASMMAGIVNARMRQVNKEIAPMMRCEYPKLTVDQIENELNVQWDACRRRENI